MMSRNQPRPTKEEAQRMKIIKAGGCMLTWLKFGEQKYAEVHHILIGGHRAGHWYTIPLSPWYHQRTCDPGKTMDEMRAKYGASTRDGSKLFVASHHYTELELWQKLQVLLGLDDSLPPTKIVPRRTYVDTDATSRGGSGHPGSEHHDDHTGATGKADQSGDRCTEGYQDLAQGALSGLRAPGEGEGR